MRSLWIRCCVVFAAFGFATAHAGNVITTNLPNGDVIIAVDGRADGAAAFNGPGQDDWYQPFNTNQTLLEYTFQPGTYNFRIIDSADASVMFPQLTSAQLSEIGNGAWTFNSPWINQYMAWDASALNNPDEHQLFTGAVGTNTYTDASAAYQAAIAGGYYDTIVTGSGRNTGTVQSSYTFTSTETLIFAVPDYYLPDNDGVVGVLISQQSVPEPSTALLLGTAIAGLGALRVGRKIYRGKSRSSFNRSPSHQP
jgi:PEP-CTERM motif